MTSNADYEPVVELVEPPVSRWGVSGGVTEGEYYSQDSPIPVLRWEDSPESHLDRVLGAIGPQHTGVMCSQDVRDELLREVRLMSHQFRPETMGVGSGFAQFELFGLPVYVSGDVPAGSCWLVEGVLGFE